MDLVHIPLAVLASIDGVTCEPLEWSVVSELREAEQYCSEWIDSRRSAFVSESVSVDELRVLRFEKQGHTHFDAMRWAVVELSAKEWMQSRHGHAVKATPLPQHATPDDF